MPRKLETLNHMLDQAQEYSNKGDTSRAKDLVDAVAAACLVVIAEKMTAIEKHFAAMAEPFYQAFQSDAPLNLESTLKVLKPKP